MIIKDERFYTVMRWLMHPFLSWRQALLIIIMVHGQVASEAVVLVHHAQERICGVTLTLKSGRSSSSSSSVARDVSLTGVINHEGTSLLNRVRGKAHSPPASEGRQRSGPGEGRVRKGEVRRTGTGRASEDDSGEIIGEMTDWLRRRFSFNHEKNVLIRKDGFRQEKKVLFILIHLNREHETLPSYISTLQDP